MIRVLGIDPGLANTGWGVVELTQSAKYKVICTGTIKTKKEQDFPNRLTTIVDSVLSLISVHNIKYVSAEDIFFTRNVSSAIEVAKVIGALSYAVANVNKPMFLYTPTCIKQMVSGSGKADKEFVRKTLLLQLENPEYRFRTDHECDSVAAAVTFFIQIHSSLNLSDF